MNKNTYTWGNNTIDNNMYVGPDYNHLYNFSCVNLLPCGVCRLTNQICPKNNNWEVQWINYTTSSDKISGCQTFDINHNKGE